jgi:deazaflavin-dependent oxidoreductase (nitroreductase family)
MPMPLWWGHINKRVFNPPALRGKKWQVVGHVGRSSGRPYRTPVDAMRVDDGFIVTLVYGSRSDWVQNVLAAGTATIEVDGATITVAEPEVITAEQAFALLPTGTKRPPKLLKIDEFLRLRLRRTPGDSPEPS